ncbi:unnamed protein product [Penicillium camemberti]|uniref:Str. FM013 n=1 Tax=Penicillium camemberti (strain FM 013) TaxID=1429867 RepID=A0A0G4PXA6_PENC3|nr:unnamed protein product [Penicillium camemberti]
MASLSDIRKEILEIDIPKRIVIRLKTGSLDSQDYRASANRVVSEVFPDWESDSRILFLVIDVWSERTFIVIDINHHDYDFWTAHKAKTVLPVFVLRQHGKRRDWVLIRWPQGDEPLGAQLADLHNVNGFDATPFLENHNSRIVHANPREFLV